MRKLFFAFYADFTCILQIIYILMLQGGQYTG